MRTMQDFVLPPFQEAIVDTEVLSIILPNGTTDMLRDEWCIRGYIVPV
jgi:hypothetical protein